MKNMTLWIIAKLPHRKLVMPLGLCAVFLSGMRPLFAQGYGGPLTYQGLERQTLHSANSRAMGGVSVAVRNDIGLMFQNPATLASISGIHLSLGGLQLSAEAKQAQDYAPVRYYPNLSLLLEGLTDRIPDPDSTRLGFSPQDSVQRPFDTIGPNWSRARDRSAPLHALAAAALASGRLKIVAGVGAVEYASLDQYYQNNNVLSPAILSQRPLPTLRPTDGNPVRVAWSQSLRSREGTIRGYGIALSAAIEKLNLAFGFSGMLLDGRSDDFEQQTGRGRLTFYSNAFRAEPAGSKFTKIGSSDYSGRELTLSSLLAGRFASIGFAIKLPATITRSFTLEVEQDSAGMVLRSTRLGEEKLELPWRGTIGMALRPKDELTIGLEYEFRPYNTARYIDSDGVETTPWLRASLFRIGAEYRLAPWVALRGGLRGQAETFQPEGGYLTGEPVTYTVYSAGLGVSFSGLRLNVAYESSLMKYQDIWASAISKNQEQRHMLLAQIAYDIQ